MMRAISASLCKICRHFQTFVDLHDRTFNRFSSLDGNCGLKETSRRGRAIPKTVEQNSERARARARVLRGIFRENIELDGKL